MAPTRALFLGLDVRKKMIVAAYVGEERKAEVVFFSTFGIRQYDIDRLSQKIRYEGRVN